MPPAAACADAARSVDFSPSFQMHKMALIAQGKPAEAEQLLRQTLAYQEQALRPDDPGIGVTLRTLGESYYDQGQFSEAEQVLVRALAINGKVFGPDSTEAGKSAGRLALVYHHQGKTEQAAPLYQRTLRILEREYGQRHPDVGFYRNSYGELLSNTAAGQSP
jgi:tetratricopeptide (TPR) repeat protein